MRLIDNWRNAHKFWSVRLALVATGLEVLGQVLPYLDIFIPPRPLAVVTIVVALAAAGARYVAQPEAYDHDATDQEP
jgi:hypothetical protein